MCMPRAFDAAMRPLPVRRPGEGHAELAPRDLVDDLRHVAGGVYVGIGGPELIVHFEAARSPDGETRGLGECELGPHAYREEDDAGLNEGSRTESSAFPSAPRIALRPSPVTTRTPFPSSLAAIMEPNSPVHRRHEPGHELDDGGLQAALPRKASTISRPMKPPPATSADFGSFASR